MLQMIKLEKDDIITRPFGDNISIWPDNNGPVIIFSPEAAEEFVNDIAMLKGAMARANKTK